MKKMLLQRTGDRGLGDPMSIFCRSEHKCGRVNAILLTLPLALSPVSHMVSPRWPNSCDLSSLLTMPAWKVIFVAITLLF
jgi:hypothetical protein